MQNVKTVDSRGRPCPLPVMDLALAAKELSADCLLLLLATDQAAEKDVRAWCAATGHQTVEVRYTEGVWHFWVAKKPSFPD